ncbi:sigma-54-dependent Fis family transcriptional regulator [bacterium]|nr:sigma-54-dependent Fis family transcriptional regulator [bacterium]
MSHRILVVEDDLVLNRSLVERLTREGHACEGVATAAETRAALSGEWDLILLDMCLPDATELSLLGELRAKGVEQPIVMMTAHSSVESAVAAIKLGADDYLKKPFEAEELALRVRNVLETRALRREVHTTRARQRERGGLAAVIGETPPMKTVHELVRRVAASEASTVLLSGESGTGKDLIAKAIHFESSRADGPFMTVTCTAIAEQLLESELFGHEKGAFTNAHAQKRGLLELANGGTVFLDEIGDLSLGLQAKLLRFLQDKTFKRVGGARDTTVDARIVAATNQPLPERVAEGRFREDLYYRLKVVDIAVPPLRDRVEDIPVLARSFVAALNKELRRNVESIAPEAEACMRGYRWPGNVRELKNAVERAMILGQGKAIEVADLPIEVRSLAAPRSPEACEPGGGATPACLAPSSPSAAAPRPAAADDEPATDAIYRLPRGGVDLERLERELVRQAIAAANGNKSHAGRLLGLKRGQVSYRLEKYGLLDCVDTAAEEPVQEGWS